MAKLLPPIIQGRLPAQNSGESSVKIPYKLNPAVGFREFNCMYLKLKSVSTGSDIGDPISATAFSGRDSKGNYIAEFSIDKDVLAVNSYYKAQIAFACKSTKDGKEQIEIGYYSSVGVFKYGCPGEAIITNLKQGSISVMPVFLRGNYINEDTAEKAQSYQFIIYNADGKIVEQSEELLDPYYEIKMRPKINVYYLITMVVNTINGFIVKSGEYKVLSMELGPLEATVSLTEDLEKGCIRVSVEGLSNGTYQLEANGKPLLTKTLFGEGALTLSYLDRNCEQGVEYKYILYKMEPSGQFSASTRPQSITIDFEDMFLHDDEKAVCIRYNPKVSSFKTALLESKQEAIGNKYPYFFRNGNVGYKEFTIGGLISRLADLNEDSTIRSSTKADVEGNIEFATNLSANNFKLEREYKLELLDWLNNGKIKMFRSPAEGNYCVRLMNVSLSPQDTLGRMLHSFTCTAYEAADIDYFNKREVVDTKEMEIYDYTVEDKVLSDLIDLEAPGAYEFRYSGAENDILAVLYDDGEEQSFTVGYTGTVIAAEVKNIIRFSSTNANSKISYSAKKYTTAEIISTMIIEEYEGGSKVEDLEGCIRIEIYADEAKLINNYTKNRSVGDLSYVINGNNKATLKVVTNQHDGELEEDDVKVEIVSITRESAINSLSLGADVKARVVRKVSAENATTN